MTRGVLILCEGYDDRAFLSGLLGRLGFREPHGARLPSFRDSLGPRAPGAFAFVRDDVEARLVPAQSRQKLATTIRHLLRQADAVAQVIVALDADDLAGAATTSADDQIRAIGAEHPTVTVTGAVWRCDDPRTTPGVPPSQTLERVVCAALAEVWPKRAVDLQEWLDREPIGGHDAKNHAMGWFAKWWAHERPGQEERQLYSLVWDHPDTARALERRLGDWWRTLAPSTP